MSEEREARVTRFDSAQPAHWLVVGANLDPKFGGISAVLGPLCQAASADETCCFSLAAFSQSGESKTPPLPSLEQAYPLGIARWLKDPSLWRRLALQITAAQGIHIHGVWQIHCAFTAMLARRARTPYVVSPHGMLDPWALEHKGFKKKLYSFAVEKGNLANAACLHALTASEADDCRRFAGQRPIAVIPNGVSLSPGDPEIFFEQHPELRGRRIVLFLGRLHPKKGVDLLCRAWSQVAPTSPDAHLVIAGPDFESTRAKLESLSGSLKLAHRVTFTGMLEGALKWSALAASYLFVLPSHSEGLSVAVLEAMGMGLPVIVTEQCHIPQVASWRCGWTIQPDASQLEQALGEALALPPAALNALGQHGKRLVEAEFRWPVVGEKMAALYRWILGGPQPSNVELV